jgi:hypothetical protein
VNHPCTKHNVFSLTYNYLKNKFKKSLLQTYQILIIFYFKYKYSSQLEIMKKSYFKINNQIFIVIKIELLYVFNRLLGKYILLFYDSNNFFHKPSK